MGALTGGMFHTVCYNGEHLLGAAPAWTETKESLSCPAS